MHWFQYYDHPKGGRPDGEDYDFGLVDINDRPYRRLVDDLPVRYVGFVVPDELFVGYGFDLDERYRELPDLRLLDLSGKGPN